jgi:Uma2 family endonuclease
MTIEEMREKKLELGLTSEMIAELSGVPVSTVRKIFSGATKAPRKLTIDAITRVLRKESEPGHDHSAIYEQTESVPAFVKESFADYSTSPRQKKSHTLKDYYALTEERRVELIDGVFYDMTGPSLRHQSILLNLAIQFRACIEGHHSSCEVYIAPCDVRLDKDDYTMVQPDLFVICGDFDRNAMCYEGAPDLVVEILSPTTRSKDMLLKLFKYQQAGVREYWIVDPKFNKVTVHFFDTDEYDPKQYSFSDVIPIAISDGQCSIDFTMI